ASAGGVVKFSGSGKTYRGDTAVTFGATLKMGTANSLPSGNGKGNVVLNAVAFGTGPTLDLNGFDTAINGLNGTSSAVNGTIIDSVTGTTTLTIGNGDANGTFAGNIASGTGTINLVKTGLGTETLGGVNTYTGTTMVNGGTLVVEGTIGSTA